MRYLVGRQRDQHLAVGGREDVGEAELAFAFPAPAVAGGEQAAEPAVGGAGGGVG